MMKANELQETKTLVDIDDTYPEEIVVEGEGGFEYGLSREEERGLIGFIRNLTRPTRRKVIEPEKTVFRQKVDAPAGEYTKEYTPAKYGEEEVDFDYAPAVRGTRAAFEYAKSLFGSEETREEAIAALKQAPEAVEKSMKEQMTAALGMTQGAESMVTREGEEIAFDPLAVPATMVPGGIAARAAATEGSTVLGIFGGKKGKSFADREAAFEKAVNDGLKDEADLPDSWKGDEYLSKMFLDQDVFEKSGGAFRGEDGILRYEIPTRNVKLKTSEQGGVFRNIDNENMSFDFEAFDKLQKRKVKEVRDNPENFLPEGRDINERNPDGSLVYNKNDILEYQNPITLKDVLDFPELYSEYPSLANLKFEFGDLPEGASASYTPFSFTGPSIAIGTQDTSKREIIKNILHETQHAVDHKEDRQYGASFAGYLPRNASDELDKIAMSARIATQTLEGSFPPEKFGNLYPDANNYKALRGLSHKDARTIDLVRKLNSPELIEDMRARNPNPESHAGKLIEAYDSMDDMQRIMFKLYDEKMGDKYKRLTEIYEEAQRKYLSTPGEVDARNVEDRFDNPDQQIGGDSPVLPTIFKDTDDAGRTIHKDMSLTGGADVDDVAFKTTSDKMISVFPKPERMFPEGNRPKGGDYLNPQTGEVLSGRNVSSANIKINPDGKPSFQVSDDSIDEVGSIGKGKSNIKVNLFKKKAGWKWDNAPEQFKDIGTLVSVEHKGKHFYTLETDFSKGVTLKKYPDSKTEPRLRPTVVGNIEIGEQVGSISVRGKKHPVYGKITTYSRGGLMARK